MFNDVPNSINDIIIKNTKKETFWSTRIELLFVVTIWAATFVSTKIVLAQITPAVSALYRYVIASLILLFINRKNREKVEKVDYPCMFLLGLTGITLYYLLQHYGIKYTNATDASILISLSPVFIALISWFILKERISFITILGFCLAFLGSILVISNGKFTLIQLDGRLLGNVLILLTAVSWAVYCVYGKRLLRKYSSKTLITYTTLIGTVMIIPFSLIELSRVGNYNLNLFGWLNMVYLGGAASVYGYLAWYRALAKLPAVTVGSFLYFRPLLTAIIAATILNEKVSVSVILGGIFIIGGTYLSAKK